MREGVLLPHASFLDDISHSTSCGRTVGKFGVDEVTEGIGGWGQILAIARKMMNGRNRQDILDGAYHRYNFHDEGLPRWFVEDEQRHLRYLTLFPLPCYLESPCTWSPCTWSPCTWSLPCL